jgi:DNA-binding transcriptional ArsR family regulator
MANPNAVFRALSDPTRREILKMLRHGPLASGDIAAQFTSTWATISRHLSILREADLISAERNGNSISYELNTTVVHEVLNHILGWTNKEGNDDA